MEWKKDYGNNVYYKFKEIVENKKLNSTNIEDMFIEIKDFFISNEFNQETTSQSADRNKFDPFSHVNRKWVDIDVVTLLQVDLDDYVGDFLELLLVYLKLKMTLFIFMVKVIPNLTRLPFIFIEISQIFLAINHTLNLILMEILTLLKSWLKTQLYILLNRQIINFHLVILKDNSMHKLIRTNRINNMTANSKPLKKPAMSRASVKAYLLSIMMITERL
jgi:hypothetical protein